MMMMPMFYYWDREHRFGVEAHTLYLQRAAWLNAHCRVRTGELNIPIVMSSSDIGVLLGNERPVLRHEVSELMM